MKKFIGIICLCMMVHSSTFAPNGMERIHEPWSNSLDTSSEVEKEKKKK